MTHTRETSPLRYYFYIGAVRIAEIRYIWPDWYLNTEGDRRLCYRTMKEAMCAMHEKLNSPPPEHARQEFEHVE